MQRILPKSSPLSPKSPIEELPKISPAVAKDLRKLEIKTISDLLFYFPFRYEDFSQIKKIAEVTQDEQVSVKGIIKQIKPVYGFGARQNRAEAIISDDSGSIKIVWFNQYYLANTLKQGDEIFISGTPRYYKSLQFQNPIYEKISPEGTENIHTARIIPIYRLTGKLTLRSLRTLMHQALAVLPMIDEYLPTEVLQKAQLPELRETIKNLHFPESESALELARYRMAFEEIFYAQLAIQKHKRELAVAKAKSIPFNKDLIAGFLETLPFELTAAQKLAAWEILQDLEQEKPMNRLLQGEVGSGKTLVAFTAALEVLQSGCQAVLLCPTEILAQQHYAGALKHFENYPNFSIILLTSNSAQINGTKANKAAVIEEIEHGGPQLVISTHAVLEKDVNFSKLALIIIDEQHRFGVRQRSALKHKNFELQPHLLSMTATPIPRTLKLSLFGDLQVSEIKTLPQGRKPIITKFISEKDRQASYDFILEKIKEGRQAFVITPLIEESDRLGVKSATLEQELLQQAFPKHKVGLLHGKMKAADKEAAMQDFLANKTQILVSTSVIEVGVDVPNASVIIIEGADRFGLAQLHQFRGRVGRSVHQSYCFLFSQNGNEKTISRLNNFCQTLDGFKLAEADLESRGFGNIFGEEQSGFYYFKFFKFTKNNIKISDLAKEIAQEILKKDPKLKNNKFLNEKISDKVIHLE